MKRSFWMDFIGIFFLLVLLYACSSTKLISSWNTPDASVQKFNKVLVIALMGNRDRNLRENVENAIAKRLQNNGIDAGSAYAEYGPKTFENLDESLALKRIRNKGYDGTFIIALLDKSKEKRYNPGRIGFYPNSYRFWGYYRNIYTRIYQPGYYTITNNFMLEANFYDLKADKLIYSAQTKSVDPASPQTLAEEFSEKLFTDMAQKDITK